MDRKEFFDQYKDLFEYDNFSTLEETRDLTTFLLHAGNSIAKQNAALPSISRAADLSVAQAPSALTSVGGSSSVGQANGRQNS